MNLHGYVSLNLCRVKKNCLNLSIWQLILRTVVLQLNKTLNALLDNFYGDWAFSGTSQKVPVSMLNSVAYTLHYRTGSNISLGMILIHVMEQLGFDVELMVFENDIQVLLKSAPVEGFLIDPCSGGQRWYIKPENDSDEQLEDAFQQLFDEDLEKLFFGSQKWAFISEKKYGDAFRCVEKIDGNYR